MVHDNRSVMHFSTVSVQKLLHCFYNDFENNLENNVWNLEHNAEKLQEILDRIMQRIVSIIISAIYISNKREHCSYKGAGMSLHALRCSIEELAWAIDKWLLLLVIFKTVILLLRK